MLAAHGDVDWLLGTATAVQAERHACLEQCTLRSVNQVEILLECRTGEIATVGLELERSPAWHVCEKFLRTQQHQNHLGTMAAVWGEYSICPILPTGHLNLMRHA